MWLQKVIARLLDDWDWMICDCVEDSKVYVLVQAVIWQYVYVCVSNLTDQLANHWMACSDVEWVTIFWTSPSIMPSFGMMLDLILGLIQKTKWRWSLEFSIILSLMLIVTSDAGFHTKHLTKLQHQSEQSRMACSDVEFNQNNLPNAFNQFTECI